MIYDMRSKLVVVRHFRRVERVLGGEGTGGYLESFAFLIYFFLLNFSLVRLDLEFFDRVTTAL